MVFQSTGVNIVYGCVRTSQALRVSVELYCRRVLGNQYTRAQIHCAHRHARLHHPNQRIRRGIFRHNPPAGYAPLRLVPIYARTHTHAHIRIDSLRLWCSRLTSVYQSTGAILSMGVCAKSCARECVCVYQCMVCPARGGVRTLHQYCVYSMPLEHARNMRA